MRTVDLTDRYYQDAFMRGGKQAWALDRSADPVSAVIVHHTGGETGYYGQFFNDEDGEVDQLDRMARHHAEAWGIGPGYHYALFPFSGRLYAIGKYGTRRAHTKGRQPGTRAKWNRRSLGIVVFGNFEARSQFSGAEGAMRQQTIVDGMGRALEEIRGYAGAFEVGVHGLVPTVNSVGVPYGQETACPGRYLRDILIGERLWQPDADNLWSPPPTPPLVDAARAAALREERAAGRTEGYKAGFTKGRVLGAVEGRAAAWRLVAEGAAEHTDRRDREVSRLIEEYTLEA
jgi:hypothetical protein